LANKIILENVKYSPEKAARLFSSAKMNEIELLVFINRAVIYSLFYKIDVLFLALFLFECAPPIC